jgi:multidrug efflux pump subunit AcrA (membrane-fusion protein)
MYQPDSLQVRADVRFENLPLVHLNQRVSVNNPALEQPIAGQVLFASSQADIQKNTLQVKVALESPASVLKPEMLVDVTFLGDERNENAAPAEALRVYAPRQLIQDGPGDSYVWVANQLTQTAVKTSVKTGPVLGDLIEITSGLNPSSRLITAKLDKLRDGQRIRLEEETEYRQQK